MASSFPGSEEEGPPSSTVSALEALVRENGLRKDDARTGGRAFGADMVLREDNGFELWLGSLEDATHLECMRDQGISGILNCALEECLAECASFRPTSSRRARSHTRGVSLLDEKPKDSGGPQLHRDQVWALVEFNGEWYSDMLGHDVSYHCLSARDEEDYDLAQHFPEIVMYLEQCRDNGRKVFVHCLMGINRSAAAIIAFLCSGLGMSLEAAVDLTSRSRGNILSNRGFVRQLIESYGPDTATEEEAAGPAAGDDGCDGERAASAADDGAASNIENGAGQQHSHRSSPPRADPGPRPSHNTGVDVAVPAGLEAVQVPGALVQACV